LSTPYLQKKRYFSEGVEKQGEKTNNTITPRAVSNRFLAIMLKTSALYREILLTIANFS